MSVFVIARGPLPPIQAVRLLTFDAARTEAQEVDIQGQPIGAPFWLPGRPRCWRFRTAGEAHRYIDQRRSAAEVQPLTTRVIR